MGTASVTRWLKPPGPKRTRNKTATKIDMVALARDVVAHPDAYQYERARRFGVSAQGINDALRRLGVTYKKNAHASKDVRGRVFQTIIKMYGHQGRPLVYIDESGFAHDMPRTHGYAPTGQRCDGLCDWQARGRTNAIGALIGKTLLAVGLFKTNVTADIFTTWVKQDLLPRLPENPVIVNATFHKLRQNIIRKAGHTLLFLPPYSPDPIEQKWTHLKAVRKQLLCSIEQLFQSESFYMG